MVGAEDVRVVGDILHHGHQSLGDQEIVQTPATVLQPLFQPHGPPGIGALHLRIPGTKDIDQSQA